MKKPETNERPKSGQPVQLDLPGIPPVVGKKMDLFPADASEVEGGRDHGSPD
jgi:hypothetical protein